MNTINKQVKKVQLAEKLERFCGTQYYHQYSRIFPFTFLTDGAHYLGEQGYFWLFDIIASLQTHSDIRDDVMLNRIQFWHLTVREDRSAEIICARDRGNTAHKVEIPYTDSILDEVMLYLQPLHISPWDRNEEGKKVIHLPSEY